MRGRVFTLHTCLSRARCLEVALFAVFAAAVFPASAQQESREREALRRTQQMISRLQQDNAGLQREKAELEQKLAAAEAELKKA